MKIVPILSILAMAFFLLYSPPLPVSTFTDTFTDNNGTLLSDHGPWIVFLGTIDIQENEANTLTIEGPAPKSAGAVIETNISDGRVSIDGETVGSGGHSAIALIFRYQDATHYWMWGVNPAAGTAHLGYWNPEWTEVLRVAPGFQYGHTYNLEALLEGDRIDLYVDDIWYAGINNGLFQTATKHGFRGETVTGHRFDNFKLDRNPNL